MIYRIAILNAALMAGIGFTTPAYAIASAEVPFVGCKSDGQVGPQDAPIGRPKTIPISPQLAQTVAYYKASDGVGVLAPRGWYCFRTYGSDGSNLYVTPMPLNFADLFSDSWKGISSYGIQLSESNGDTSGRFEVAQIIARVFPAHSAFVRRVIAEGVEPATSFPYGPYPADKLTYKSKETVEYVTPPNTEGLGTKSFLIKDADPIDGVALLTGEELSLTHLSARLPPEMSNLLPVIIRQVEQDTSQSATSGSATGDKGMLPLPAPSPNSQTTTPHAPTTITLPALNEQGVKLVTNLLLNDIETAARGGDALLKPEETLRLTGIDLETTAEQYDADYDANEVSADQKYDGKTILLTGVIESINEDFKGDAFLVLKTSKPFMGVHAELNERGKAGAAALAKSTTIYLVCESGTRIMESASARNCEQFSQYLNQIRPSIKSAAEKYLQGQSSAPTKLVQGLRAMYVIGTQLPPDSPCFTKADDACSASVASISKDKAKMQALTSQMRRTFPTLPQVTTTDAAGISNLQIVKGTCDSSSHTAEGPLGIDLTKRQSRFFCDSAVITFFDDYKGHEMVQFAQRESHHSPILGFAGRVEDDGIMMQVDTVYLVPGQAMKVSDGWCKFFSKNRQMSDIVCGMKVDETGRRTTAAVVFNAAPAQ